MKTGYCVIGEIGNCEKQKKKIISKRAINEATVSHQDPHIHIYSLQGLGNLLALFLYVDFYSLNLRTINWRQSKEFSFSSLSNKVSFIARAYL